MAKKYYNFPKMIKDLYELMSEEDITISQKNTLREMIDECVFHFLEAHQVPYERQGEFLEVMLDGCPKAVSEYKTKKFS